MKTWSGVQNCRKCATRQHGGICSGATSLLSSKLTYFLLVLYVKANAFGSKQKDCIRI